TFLIGMSSPTGDPLPSVSAASAPREYLQDARDAVAAASSGRSTVRSHSGGVGGRVSASPSSGFGGGAESECPHARAKSERTVKPTSADANRLMVGAIPRSDRFSIVRVCSLTGRDRAGSEAHAAAQYETPHRKRLHTRLRGSALRARRPRLRAPDGR